MPPYHTNHIELSDPVKLLMREMAEYELAMLKLGQEHRNAVNNRRDTKVYYNRLMNKLSQLDQMKIEFQEDLYYAVISGNEHRIEKAEDKFRKYSIEQHFTQLELPGSLKALGQSIRCENRCKEAIRELHTKMVRKQEEIHRMRPCQVFLCDHCRTKRDKQPLPEEMVDGRGYGGTGGLASKMMRTLRRVKSWRV